MGKDRDLYSFKPAGGDGCWRDRRNSIHARSCECGGGRSFPDRQACRIHATYTRVYVVYSESRPAPSLIPVQFAEECEMPALTKLSILSLSLIGKTLLISS